MRFLIYFAAIPVACLFASIAVGQSDDNPFDFDSEAIADPFADESEVKGDPFGEPSTDVANQEKEQAEALKRELEELNKRLNEMAEAFEKAAYEKNADSMRMEYEKLLATTAYLSEHGLQAQARCDEMVARYDMLQAEMHDRQSAAIEEIAELQEELERLRRENYEASDSARALDASNELNHELMNTLLLQGLSSESPDRLHDTLQNLLTTISKAPRDYTWLARSTPVRSELARLLEHETEAIRRLAAQVLMQGWPTEAAKHGLQSADSTHWVPLEALDASPFDIDLPRHRLTEPVWLYADMTIEDAVKDIASQFDLTLPPTLPESFEKEIGTPISEVPFARALTLILNEVDHDFVLRDNVLELGMTGSPDLNVALTYDVRGLISDQQTVESIAALVGNSLKENEGGRVDVLGGSRIRVTATEMQHYAISGLLAKLPRNF